MLFALILLTSGCGQSDTNIWEYGKVSGLSGSGSANGTSVFYDMFRERGFKTKRYKRISPRINKYNTIIWVPDNHDFPDDEAVNALNEWLQDGYQRTLIYVGRDYEANVDYLEYLTGNTEVQDREEVQRRLAEAKFRQDNRHHLFGKEQENCQWFEKKHVPRQKAKVVSGPLASGVDTSEASIEMSTLLVPNTAPNRSYRDLLKTDGGPFAFEITQSRLPGDSRKIIVVSNGSFILNFGLTNESNQEIAANLIDECDINSDVLFLESGPFGIMVSDQDVNHNNWGWIAQPPLRYIVPHFLFWGVLFCFAYYPIFGRPRRLKAKENVSFRNHVHAMGRLLKPTKTFHEAWKKVQNFKKNNGRDFVRDQKT